MLGYFQFPLEFRLIRLSDNSDRVSVEGEQLFEPYTQLGWDQNAPGLEGTDVKDISRLDRMTGFGRPLFVLIFWSNQ